MSSKVILYLNGLTTLNSHIPYRTSISTIYIRRCKPNVILDTLDKNSFPNVREISVHPLDMVPSVYVKIMQRNVKLINYSSTRGKELVKISNGIFIGIDKT